MKKNHFESYFDPSNILNTGQKVTNSCLNLMDVLSKPKLKIALIISNTAFVLLYSEF